MVTDGGANSPYNNPKTGVSKLKKFTRADVSVHMIKSRKSYVAPIRGQNFAAAVGLN